MGYGVDYAVDEELGTVFRPGHPALTPAFDHYATESGVAEMVNRAIQAAIAGVSSGFRFESVGALGVERPCRGRGAHHFAGREPYFLQARGVEGGRRAGGGGSAEHG